MQAKTLYFHAIKSLFMVLFSNPIQDRNTLCNMMTRKQAIARATKAAECAEWDSHGLLVEFALESGSVALEALSARQTVRPMYIKTC